MSNLAATKKAEARRAKRAAQAAKAEQQARADIERLPADTAKARLDAVDNKDNQAKIATDTPGVLVDEGTRRVATKAAMKRQVQVAADAQAKRDALRSPEPAEDNYKPGDIIPLHVLNQRAKQANAEARDEATKIAKEIGMYSRDLIEGRQPRMVINRSRKMRDAMVARELAAQAAKKE